MTWLILSICMFFERMCRKYQRWTECIRGVMISWRYATEFLHILHPGCTSHQNWRKNVLPSAVPKPMAFFALYIPLCLRRCIYISMGIESTDAVISLSSLSNVGPALGNEISPHFIMEPPSDSVKWVCSAFMLLGRLEIFTVLVIFTPDSERQLIFINDKFIDYETVKI